MLSQPFHFELATQVSEGDYITRQFVQRPRTRRHLSYLTLATIVGAAALLSLRTTALGVVILIICTFVWTAPQMARWASRHEYSNTNYLHGPLTYGVSDQKLWFRSAHLYSESTWAGLINWDERGGTLRLAASGLPELFFSVDELRGAGVYERLREQLKDHGVDFNPPNEGRGDATA